MSAAAPVLEAEGLRVERAGRTVVAAERLALRRGEVHVLLGRNGAGKSTLLRALDGLEPASGRLVFEGREVRSAADRLALRRRTAAVFQQPYLLDASVVDNVATGLRLRGVARGEARRRALAALERLGVAHLAGRRATRLSGGEAQRVSLARAFAVDPVVLFLDEPFASLDPPTRRGLLEDLGTVLADSGTAALWVTHDRDEALAVADTVSFLDGGRVTRSGPALEVFARPRDASLAEFLGLDAYLEGEVEQAPDGQPLLRLRQGPVLLCGEAPPGPAVACLPPEDVVLLTAPPPAHGASLRNVVWGKVKAVGTVGRLLRVVVAADGLEVSALVTPAAFEDLGLAVGSRVAAAFKASAVHPIPRPGGRRP